MSRGGIWVSRGKGNSYSWTLLMRAGPINPLSLPPVPLPSFFLGWDTRIRPLLPTMNYWQFISLFVLLQDIHRKAWTWCWASSERRVDSLYHVRNDRRQSAFRVPAFIMVNVDDTGLLPSWQTVTELSGWHNHWLHNAMITFKLMNANLLGATVAWAVRRAVCACMCLSAPRQYIQMLCNLCCSEPIQSDRSWQYNHL